MYTIFLCFFILLSFQGIAFAEEDYADTVLLNGSIYTVEPGTDWEQTPQEAIALKGNSILALDSISGIEQYIGPQTTVYNLSGKMVLPGFIDTHIHLGLAAQLMAGVDLINCTSVPEIQDTLQQYAADHPQMPVIRGFGWNYFLFQKSGPDKSMIDQVILDKPVILTSFDGHSIWVNTPALAIAGIDHSTPDPKGGKIDRDEEGNPTGVLHEMSAANLVIDKVPPLTSAQFKEVLMTLLPRASSYGITTADDAAVTPDIIEAFSELEEEGALPVRIFGEIVAIPELGEAEIPAMVAASDLADPLFETGAEYGDDLPAALHGDSVRFVPVQSVPSYSDSSGLFRIQTGKLFLDGVIEGHTGYLLDPYADQPESNGTINWDPETFTQMIADLDRLGFQIDIHAIGDSAVRMSLDAYENAREINGERDSRHKISHIQLINETDIPRLNANRIIAALQPNWFYYDANFENVSSPYLGSERANRMYSLRSILESGAIVSFGTDYPVGTDYLTFNPLDGIRTAVTRLPLPPDSIVTIPYQPQELIDLKTALESATYWGAYTNFMENQTGSLTPGKLADVIVLDQDLFTVPLNEINQVRVVATYLEGKETFFDPSFSCLDA